MANVDIRRAVVDRLVRKSREEAAIKRKNVTTIDPVLKVAKREYPFMSEKEITEYASVALRVILHSTRDHYQLTLTPQGF